MGHRRFSAWTHKVISSACPAAMDRRLMGARGQEEIVTAVDQGWDAACQPDLHRQEEEAVQVVVAERPRIRRHWEWD